MNGWISNQSEDPSTRLLFLHGKETFDEDIKHERDCIRVRRAYGSRRSSSKTRTESGLVIWPMRVAETCYEVKVTVKVSSQVTSLHHRALLLCTVLVSQCKHSSKYGWVPELLHVASRTADVGRTLEPKAPRAPTAVVLLAFAGISLCTGILAG